MTALRKKAAALPLLTLTGACLAAAAYLGLRSPAPIEPGPAASSSAAPAAAVRRAAHSFPAVPESSSRHRVDEDDRLPASGGAAKVSERSLASSSSTPPAATDLAAVRDAASHQARENSIHRAVASGHAASPSADTGRESARSGSALSSPASARTAAAEVARIAQSAASLPLSHSVSGDQVRQAAPNVPQEALDSVRDRFEQAAGVGQFDPSDPEYARRWDTAAREAADQMRSLYGWGAYSAMQRQTALASSSQPGQ